MTKPTGRTSERAYLKTLRSLGGDVEGRAAANAYLRSTSLATGDARIAWGANPVLLDAKDVEVLEAAAKTLGTIMEKVMAKYHRDHSFRALFKLPADIERLTMVPSGCHAAVPLSRVELFYDRKTRDYTISSIATGGVSGMAESVEVMRAVSQMDAFHEFAKTHEVEPFDAVERCVLTLLHTYGHWANSQEGRNHPTNPALAVVDVPGSARRAETDYVIERLREHGCYAHATEVGELRIERVGGVDQLVDSHGPVTCVWMRPTADEAIAHMDDGVKTLLDATRHGLVCTIGGYRSWPCCTKGFLELLRTRECQDLLTHDEIAFIEEHVDETHVIDTSTDISSFYDQDAWVIRDTDGFRLGGVRAGSSMSRSAWRGSLIKAIKRRDAVQRYIPVQLTEIMPGTEGEDPTASKEMNVLLGLYVFESSLAGVRAVCGEGDTTSDWGGTQLSLGCAMVR